MLRYKIYIIDDDLLIGEGLKHAFLEYETFFQVTTFTDPMEGLQAAISSPPDLIFLDLLMPYIKGEEILQQLKKRNIPTRVVVITAVTDVAKVVELIKGGACNYITKPFSTKEIIKIAKRVVVLEDTLDKLEPNRNFVYGRDLHQEMMYSLYLNILEHFNLTELASLCFGINVDFDNLPGSSKEEKTRELIQFCKRHNKIVNLAKLCCEIRPHVEQFQNIAKNYF
ncbi:MAG: response regulator [Ardenticatenaceae bacterium]|nr:response regulator [Ardenticatenaceae bacterium]MCB8947969.1 response regulator [Ardenticatenaceae bacterium]